LKQLRSKAQSPSSPRREVADSGLKAQRAGRAQSRPAEPGEVLPAFYDVWQSWGATWDVWSSTQLGTEHIQLLADRRLRALLLWAREHSDFYRRLYRGIALESCSIADLPIVTKSELMTHFDTVVTDPDVTRDRVREFLAQSDRIGHGLAGRYAVWTSSGSTGEPGVFLHDGRALAIYEALEILRFRHLTSPAALAAAAIARERYAMVGATGGHFAGNASVHRMRLLYPWLADRMRVFSILEPTPVLVNALNEYQPALVATYPSAASLLAEEQQRGHLSIHPREIWTGGEQLSAGQRLQITRAFGCELRDNYGASEFLAIAGECAHGTLHVNADWVVLEPVDEKYRPVPPGTPSHTVLLTNLANRIQPLIRYDLGDSLTGLARPCECGNPLPGILVEGRCDDMLILLGAGGAPVKLLPLAVTTVLEEEAGVSQFQLAQADPDRLILSLDQHIADPAVVSRCRDVLRRFLESQHAPHVRIDIQACSLPQHPTSGKRRRIAMRLAKPRRGDDTAEC
jgi:phenylacetate-coenzyme A ligase PaaK-like adenylate-forming protein